MDQIKEVLRRAQALIDKPERWIQEGTRRCEPAESGRCRCAGGAIQNESGPGQAKDRSLLCAAIAPPGEHYYWVSAFMLALGHHRRQPAKGGSQMM